MNLLIQIGNGKFVSKINLECNIAFINNNIGNRGMGIILWTQFIFHVFVSTLYATSIKRHSF